MNFLVVDDHPLMRRGVRQILDEAYVDVSITEAESGERAVECVRAEAFDLVLLDLSLPGLSGLEAIERIHRVRPGQRVLVLSMHAEEQFAVQALRAGAAGYMTKGHASDLLLAAIGRIMAGGRYLSPALAEILAGQIAGDLDGPPHGRLSAREFRVMCMLAEGHGLSHIANELAVSVKTISTYRTRILEKLGMGSNAEVARYCQRNGLVG